MKEVTRLRTPALAVLALVLLAACGPRYDASNVFADGGERGGGTGVSDPLSGGSADGGAASGGTPGADGPAGAERLGSAGTQGSETGGSASSPVDNGGATDTGVTGNSITVGGSVAVGGALPGQFLPAAQGMAAYFRMINERGGVYGRSILYHYHDDALNREAYRDNMTHLIKEDRVFALTGGMSAADDGACGFIGDVPDVGTFALSYCRSQAKNHYSPMGSLKQGIYGCCAEWGWLRDRFGYERPAVEYLTDFQISQDQGVAVVDGLVRTLGLRSRDAVYQGAQRATQPDYNAEVLNLQRRNIDAVFSSMDLPSNVRLLRAMCQQSYRPKVVHFEISSYDPTLFDRVSADCIRSQNLWLRTPHLPFTRTDNAEMRLYLRTLERFYPGAQPATFGIEGWMSAKLFVDAVRNAGPRLTRAKLYEALDGFRNWTADGLIGPNTPADRLIYHCNIMLLIEPGAFVPKTDFLCGKFFRSGDFTGPAVGP